MARTEISISCDCRWHFAEADQSTDTQAWGANPFRARAAVAVQVLQCVPCEVCCSLLYAFNIDDIIVHTIANIRIYKYMIYKSRMFPLLVQPGKEMHIFEGASLGQPKYVNDLFILQQMDVLKAQVGANKSALMHWELQIWMFGNIKGSVGGLGTQNIAPPSGE